MKLFPIFLLAYQAFSAEIPSFDQWRLGAGVSIKGPEKILREKIYLSKLAEIDAHNVNPKTTYQKGLNDFAHLSSEEFISSRCKTVLPKELVVQALGLSNSVGCQSTTVPPTTKPTTTKPTTTRPTTTKSTTGAPTPVKYPFGSFTSANAPVSVNYTNLMTPVQNQGVCGSCWAFAALGQLEGILKFKNSVYNTVLGPQYLVDCDKTNGGCNGGWPTKTFNWIKNSGGNAAPSMTAYPYTASNGVCKTNIAKLPMNIVTVGQNYMAGDEGKLKAQIANYGPAVVAIQATNNFQMYRKGVLFDATCPSGTSCSVVNHAVIVTGYGTDPSLGDFWIVKNSWGTSWGEAGYIRMARNKNNNCNIACWAMWAY